MTHLILTLAALLSAPNDQAADEATAADLRKMQGDWVVTTMKINGEVYPDDAAQVLFRTVKGSEYTVSRFSKVIGGGAFQLDATQTPRTIDSTPKNSADGKPLLGIYEFEGDKLKICNALPGKPRPKNFKAGLLSGHTLIVWEPE